MNFLRRLFGRKPKAAPAPVEPDNPRRLTRMEENKARDLLCPACNSDMVEAKVKVCRHCGKAYILIDEGNAPVADDLIKILKDAGVIK